MNDTRNVKLRQEIQNPGSICFIIFSTHIFILLIFHYLQSKITTTNTVHYYTSAQQQCIGIKIQNALNAYFNQEINAATTNDRSQLVELRRWNNSYELLKILFSPSKQLFDKFSPSIPKLVTLLENNFLMKCTIMNTILRLGKNSTLKNDNFVIGGSIVRRIIGGASISKESDIDIFLSSTNIEACVHLLNTIANEYNYTLRYVSGKKRNQRYHETPNFPPNFNFSDGFSFYAEMIQSNAMGCSSSSSSAVSSTVSSSDLVVKLNITSLKGFQNNADYDVNALTLEPISFEQDYQASSSLASVSKAITIDFISSNTVDPLQHITVRSFSTDESSQSNGGDISVESCILA
jgi:hypothetical protein